MDKIKNFVREYKGFSIVLAIEVLFLLFLLIQSIGSKNVIQLGVEDFQIYDDMVETNLTDKTFSISDTDEQKGERDILGTNHLRIKPGAYDLKVTYRSQLIENDESGNLQNSTGAIRLQSIQNPASLLWTDLKLSDGKTENTERVWVRSFADVTDLEVKVHFWGTGSLQLESVELVELPIYRLTRILGWLLVFALIDGFYYYFFMQNVYKNKRVVLGLLGIIAISSLPLVTDFLFWGHDIMFHLNRILSLAQGLDGGNLHVPIQTEMLNGYGYATPLFYGQLFLYIPALLYNMAVPLQTCYQIYVLLINIATCLVSFYCFKKLTKDSNLALLGSFLYTVSAYRITNLYVRAAVGEYTAMVFFPLVLYGFYKVYSMDGKEKIRLKDYLPIVIGLTGLLQCHLLSCELAAVFIIAVCVIYIRKTFELQRFLALAKAALLTVGLNLGFLVPFLASMQMNIYVAQDNVNKIQSKGTYLMQVLGIFHSAYGDSVERMKNEMPLSIGFSLSIGLGIFLWCCAKKYEWKLAKDSRLKLGITCAGFAITAIILSTTFFPWDSLESINHSLAKFLCALQFPWRYLAVATVFCAFVAVLGIQILSVVKGKKLAVIGSSILVAVSLLSTGLFYMQFGDHVEPIRIYSANETNTMEIGCDEYMLVGTDKTQFNYRGINANYQVMTISEYEYKNGVTSFLCSNTDVNAAFVEIPLLHYDNYHAYDESSGIELEIQTGSNNRVGIIVPPSYSGKICVAYRMPVLWRVAEMISIVVLLGIVAVIAVPKWKNVKQKSRG